MSAEQIKQEEVIPAASTSATETSTNMTVDQAKEEALRQVEFYFHDSNLPFDKFLFTLTRKDPEGWVPIATIASFKRMRGIKDLLGLEGIADALKASKELLDVSEDGVNVRRRKELVPVKDAFDRSVYAKGFGEETETLQKELESFFNTFGKVNSVRMRRDMEAATKPKPFKGSVFVEFADMDDRNKFLAQAAQKQPEHDGGKGVTFQDKELVVMSKDAYVKMKMEEKGIDPSANKINRGSDSAHKKFNAFKEMNKREGGRGDRAKKEEDNKPKRSDPLEFEYNGKQLTTRPDGTVDPDAVTFPSNSVLKFTGAGEGGNWKDLKETLITVHPTSFVEFPTGAVEGAVGFKESLSDEKLAEIKSKNITVGGNVVNFDRVDEETAKKFYIERANFRASFMLDRREQDAQRGGGFRGGNGGYSRGGRGGRGGKFGRGGGRGGFGRSGGDKRKRDNEASNNNNRDDGAPPTIGKKPKTEE
ncbi:related to LHP1 - RNA binding protein [Ustilago trichophora]|uniref:Related to LHP1 - RNA binding protein n=1 Tax=Ustilago trichophora TaxID=86804 RepID=A0A5C3EDP6_9BASI|nr:related to LHP1 - RNA binding protein [Ustilago trichophora]